MTHIYEYQSFFEETLGTTISEEVFYDAVFAEIPWFPAYVIDKARRFEAFQVAHSLPECNYFYQNVCGT